MSGRPAVPEQQWKLALDWLRDASREGPLRDWHYREAAAFLGRSPDQVARRFRSGRDDGQGTVRRARLTLDDQQIAILAAAPTLTLGLLELEKEYGKAVVGSYWRVRNAVLRLPPGKRSVIRGKGEVDLRQQVMRLSHPAEHVNEVNCIDHQSPSLLFLPEGSSGPPVYGWITTLIDKKSTVVKAAYLAAATPTAHVSGAVVAESVLGKVVDGVEVGGVPALLTHDNGKDFTSEYQEQLNAHLALIGLSTPAYTPQHDGAVDSFHDIQENRFAADQPGYTHGPRSPWHRSAISHPMVPKRADQLLTESEARWRHFQFLREYHRTPRPCLNGLTPLQAWEQDAATLEFPRFEDVVRGLFVHPRRHKIDKGGIRIHDTRAGLIGAFVGHGPAKHVGRMCTVRWIPAYRDVVFVFVDNRYVGEAYSKPSDAEKQLLLVEREGEFRDARQLAKDAAKLIVDRNERRREEDRSRGEAQYDRLVLPGHDTGPAGASPGPAGPLRPAPATPRPPTAAARVAAFARAAKSQRVGGGDAGRAAQTDRDAQPAPESGR